jgi:hypothetical protein
MRPASMPGTHVKTWRNPRILIGGALVLVAVVGIAIVSHRERAQPQVALSANPPDVQQPSDAQPPTEALQTREARQLHDAQPSAEAPDFVLVGIESKPPGVTIVHADSGFLYGHTPETVELRRSTSPVRIRFEMEGYIPLTREVSAASDSVLSITLKPSPKPYTRATQSSNAKK